MIERATRPIFGDDTIIENVDLAEEVVIVDGERLTDERADAIATDVLATVRARNLIRPD
jgi:hypothetical protein